MALRFRGGTHVRHEKERTEHKPVERIPLPKVLYVPVAQHMGAPAEPVVAKGATVKKGQLIAKAEPFVSAPVHAPSSGTVKEIVDHPHPVAGKGKTLVIETDGQDAWAEGIPTQRDWHALGADELRSAIRAGGIVGLGGATFPTHVKLTPPAGAVIHHVLVNGAECEPYLTSDDAVMRTRAEDLVTGMEILLKITGAGDAAIGIEENKPEAISRMREACKRLPNCRVVSLPTRYPQGAERSLIQAVLGKWVPAGKLPLHVNAVVQNSTTCVAIHDAVVRGIPLVEKVLTVSGAAVRTPRNVLAPIGTPWRDLLEFCGGVTEDFARLVLGGPMMGIAQSSFDAPVVKGASGLLALTHAEVQHPEEGPCLRCGTCVSVCPMMRSPLDYPTMARLRLYQQARLAGVMECVECGTCEYGCPSNRPILQSIKVLKSKVRELNAKEELARKAAASADAAR